MADPALFNSPSYRTNGKLAKGGGRVCGFLRNSGHCSRTFARFAIARPAGIRYDIEGLSGGSFISADDEPLQNFDLSL